MNNNLKRLDFSPGIKADDINYNFDLTHEWLKRERLRTAGHGLVEGFAMSADLNNFTVEVGKGMLINDAGEEVEVPKHIFSVGAPDCVDITEELIPDEDGSFQLKFVPYSSTLRGHIMYNPPADSVYPIADQLYVSSVDTGGRVPILSVVGQNIIVNANNWAGKPIRVKYKYTRNRVDSIMLHKDGTYRYEKGIMSTSPSHVDLEDYPGYLAIGIVSWVIGRTVSVQFYDSYRTYRKVFVDSQNRLYLNGKLYKESQEIYFVEPIEPKTDDLWYDHSTNMLMIWKEQDGDFGWVVINDVSTVPLRETKIWTPENFPEDAQTFLFDESEINLKYIPGSNALEIIIDNAILMQDQYDEIVDSNNNKPYLSTGAGFKLKMPLDRPTHVQLTIHHSVRSAPLRETFQRAAIFVSENYVPYNVLNVEKVFTTEAPYVIGEQQLEIFIDGTRMQRGQDFEEMVDAVTVATTGDRGKMSSTFRIVRPLVSGQKVVHKVTRHIWSFDHLNEMVNEIETKADDALIQCTQLQTDLTNLNSNTNNRFAAIDSQFNDINNKVSDLDNFIERDEKLAITNLPDQALASMVKTPFNVVKPTVGEILITDTKATDFMLVFYISQSMNRILFRDLEYSIQAVAGNVRIDLHPDLVSSEANIYITGTKFGL